MYETMKGWDSDQPFFAQSPVYQDFATQWRAARKIVYSSTLDRVTTSNTSLGRELTHKALEQLKAESDAPIAIAGPDLARTAFEAGLVDECHVFLGPVVVGGGKRFLPKGIHLPLELVDEKRFKGGFVYLGYRRRS
jgi:dihydrofolate reductase